MSDRYTRGAEQTVANTVQSDLRRELRHLGFDAFDAGLTYEELAYRQQSNADFFVEIDSNHSGHPVGGAGVSAGALAIEVGLVVARVAAVVRVYNGRTLNQIAEFDLQKNKTAFVPMAIGLGGRSVWGLIALPLVQYGQYRAAAHEVARLAAERIAGR